MVISERKIRLLQTAEKFGIHKDLVAKDIHEFAQLVKRFNPPRVNVAVAEVPITSTGTQVTHDQADYLEHASVFTFPVSGNGKSLARYAEVYTDSRLTAVNPNILELDDMTHRALLTAISRGSQLIDDVSPLTLNLFYRFSTINHLEIFSHDQLDLIKTQTVERGLAPFII